MKNIILFLIVLASCFNFSSSFANTYVTRQNGSWVEPKTWENIVSAPLVVVHNDEVVIKHIIDNDDVKITIGGLVRLEKGSTLYVDNIDLPGLAFPNTARLIVEDGSTLVISSVNGEYLDPNNPPQGVQVQKGGTIKNPGTLPVTLVSFKAQLVSKSVYVKWSTTEEINNDFIALEKSADAENFETVTVANGKNTSGLTTYDYTDNTPFAGVNYYRLKQVDFDGTVTYSGIISINNNVLEMQVTDQINFSQPVQAHIQILQADGKVVYEQNTVDTQSAPIPTLTGGVYVIKAVANGQILSKKVLF
ncbi:MAG: T9SS type A sorting domain-containing protein [Hymenobacteraceae bacterium]|nr:T9SS type A sorting domain-containing protein [Hymenobacteraceae bacterium]